MKAMHVFARLGALALALAVLFAPMAFAQTAATGEVTTPQLLLSVGTAVVMVLAFGAHWFLDWVAPRIPQGAWPFISVLVTPLFAKLGEILTGWDAPMEWTPFLGWLVDYLDDQRYWFTEWLKARGAAKMGGGTLATVLVAMVAVGMVFTGSGCAYTPVDVYKEANKAEGFQKLEWRAFSTYAVYDAYLKQAAVLLDDPNVPMALKKAMADAELRTTPLVNSLKDAFRLYEDAQSKLTAGNPDTMTALRIAVENLESWTERAKAAVDGFISVFKAARPKSAALLIDPGRHDYIPTLALTEGR